MTQCFDVFDTTLTRIWGKPEHLFLEVGKKLIEQCLYTKSMEEWMHVRQHAERQVAKEKGDANVTLNTVYDVLGTQLAWSPDERLRAMNLELATEIGDIRPVPRIQQLIQRIHKQGKNVVFFSDMYLHRQTIQGVLEKHHVWTTGDVLYVSSEYGKSKYTGELFEAYIKKYQKKPSELKYYGNTNLGDIVPAKKVGMKTSLVSDCELTRYEKALLEHTTGKLRIHSLIAGISRLTRMQQHHLVEHEKTLVAVTANVIAPILFFFIVWCLQEAKKRNIKRLYFLSRDGQIMHRIASQLSHAYSMNIECRYLYGSRHAWWAATLTTINEAAINETFASSPHITVRSACQRLLITPQDIAHILTAHNFPIQDWDRKLTPNEKLQLLPLFAIHEVAQKILSQAKKMRHNTIGYIVQEGFSDGTPSALVDIGWTGSMQHSLDTILAHAGYTLDIPLVGLYLALAQEVWTVNSSNFIAYFTDDPFPHIQSLLVKIKGHRMLMELCLQADHGTLEGYEYTNGIYGPVCLHKDPQFVSPRGLTVYQTTLQYFFTQITARMTWSELRTMDGHGTVETILNMLFLHPAKEEAEMLGSQQVSDDPQNTIYYEIAPKITHRQEKPHHLVWQSGSVARSDLPAETMRATHATKHRMLNVGCGDRYHPDWVNLDMNPSAPKIIQYDIRKKLPFANHTFDCVYHSHVLEHLTRKDGDALIQECRRVLKPGGIIRIAVPNLEAIAYSYLQALHDARHGRKIETLKHEWMRLELYDQAVRTYPGGEANEFILHTKDDEMKEFIIRRWGNVAKIILGQLPSHSTPRQTLRPFWWYIRESIIRSILGKEYSLLKTARYRNSGEIHKWMYDSHALGWLLSQHKFDHILERSPFESYIEKWESYHLDTEQDGTIIKPDSIFVEAIAV